MSPTTGRRYALTRVCAAWRVCRATVYARRRGAEATGLENDALGGSQRDDRARGRDPRPPRGKRGPRTPLNDAALLAAIRGVLGASPFHGEGHRKVRARLRPRGVHVGKARVLRVMRQANLLAPTRRRHVRGDRAHAGTIRTARPEELWGTDAARFYTRREGWCWFFGAIDHCVEDLVGWHVAKVGDRWAALEPIRQGVQRISSSASCGGSAFGPRRVSWGSPSATGS